MATPSPLPDAGAIVEVAVIGRARPPWPTRVEWMEGWALEVVAPLRHDGTPWPIEPGWSLTIGWPTDRGFMEGTGVYRGAGRDVVTTWIVDIARVERRQRRNAYRLPLRVAVSFDVGGRIIDGTSHDLSESGLQCVVPARHAPRRGEVVAFELALPELEPLTAEGRVVRCRERSATEMELGVAFTRVEAERVEQLRRFVFAEQLRRRATS